MLTSSHLQKIVIFTEYVAQSIKHAYHLAQQTAFLSPGCVAWGRKCTMQCVIFGWLETLSCEQGLVDMLVRCRQYTTRFPCYVDRPTEILSHVDRKSCLREGIESQPPFWYSLPCYTGLCRHTQLNLSTVNFQ